MLLLRCTSTPALLVTFWVDNLYALGTCEKIAVEILALVEEEVKKPTTEEEVEVDMGGIGGDDY